MWADPLLLQWCLSFKVFKEYIIPEKYVYRVCWSCCGAHHVNTAPRWLPGLAREELEDVPSTQVTLTFYLENRYVSHKLQTIHTGKEIHLSLFNLPSLSSCLLQTPICLGISAPTLWMGSLAAPPGGLTGRSTESKETRSGWVKMEWTG